MSAQISSFLAEFQRLPILVSAVAATEEVTVPVHVPYMMQSVALIDSREKFDKLAQRHQDRLRRVKEAREKAPADVKDFLHRHFYGDSDTEGLLAQGRAEPQEIRRLLQEAIDQGLVPVGKGRTYPDGLNLRNWLKKYGIGVDCSAFVQQALSRVVQAWRAATGDRHGRLHRERVGWMTTEGVYRELTAEPRETERFQLMSTPGKARPGDVLVKRGHIRVVAQTEAAEGDAVVVHLAESSSAIDIPCGQAKEEADIGPRFILVKYAQPARPIHKQTPSRKRLCDHECHTEPDEQLYVLGRLQALDRLCRESTAPEATPACTVDIGGE